MKFFLGLAFLVLFLNQLECTSQPCTCWEGYESTTTSQGTAACVGKKTGRHFGCNEPEPAICKCTNSEGKVIEQDLGITDCATANGKIQCDNQKDFEEYFKLHPERRIVN